MNRNNEVSAQEKKDYTVLLGEEYIKLRMATRMGEVDKDKLISLVLAAKGSRSMRQFADDMGVNVSSVSRIVNGKVSEISDKLLSRIAVCADPNSGVTIEKLMDAQGIVSGSSRNEIAKRFKDDCRRIVVDELLKQGYSVSYSREEMRLGRRIGICDFEIVTDALKKGGGRWQIESKMMTENAGIPVGYGWVSSWLDKAMARYYRGDIVGRRSLIVDHKDVFDWIKDKLSRLSLADEISVILISTMQGTVLDEYVAPLREGEVAERVLG